ncbi:MULTISPECIES: hypothetical protein [unclassified Sinorhizobium]|uniref:hypothetical protein n=1 Tax=unclassified Sinorhizobium TaxID=2613772 RepID=UPI0024C465B5|nr:MULTISPECIES: hypothetical protein [unclassified Sinorhizobium]MDK1375186.1 hypothetical protein [Sinorhizobium sp. 6-70]MDK1480920.1 hypothetical protein [Sinorhizobium sp. 6-117]
MRGLLLLIVGLCGLLAIDQIATDGRYRRAGWSEAKAQGNALQDRVEYWVSGIIKL